MDEKEECSLPEWEPPMGQFNNQKLKYEIN